MGRCIALYQLYNGDCLCGCINQILVLFILVCVHQRNKELLCVSFVINTQERECFSTLSISILSLLKHANSMWEVLDLEFVVY